MMKKAIKAEINSKSEKSWSDIKTRSHLFGHFKGKAFSEAKYPKSVACLLKTKNQTLAFYDFPAEHWHHIRSTNVIDSTFSTVRLRTYKTRGCCKEESILPLVFKLVNSASQRWQKLHSSNIIPLILTGVKYQDGVSVDKVDKDKTDELKAA